MLSKHTDRHKHIHLSIDAFYPLVLHCWLKEDLLSFYAFPVIYMLLQ